ncbi:MAG: hypothetical protein P8Z35_19215 [Ignavibacteriaceae bacterium]
MKEKDYFEKLAFADSIEDVDKKLDYLNSLQTDFNKIKEQDIDLSKIPFEDRIKNVSLRLENLDYAYFDYAIKTKIFLASLERSE